MDTGNIKEKQKGDKRQYERLAVIAAVIAALICGGFVLRYFYNLHWNEDQFAELRDTA